MFNEVEGLLQRAVTGEIDSASVSQAANEHVASMDQNQLQQHVQTAADNANQNGQSDIAQQLMGLVSQHGANPQGLKDAVVSLISNNPQILQQFEPSFAKDILSRI